MIVRINTTFLFYVCLVSSFVYLFFFQLYAIWPFTIDDMYITLRYARHWAEGTGLLWNIAEPPVEGYSNFSFVVLGRIAFSVGLNPVIVLKSAGVVGLLVTLIGLYQLTRTWFRPHMAVIPCFWLLSYQGQIIWSVSGLETTVFEALLVFSVLACIHDRFFISACLLSIAAITRPEAIAMVLLFAMLVTVYKDWRRAAVFSGMFFLIYAPYFFWHWCYYGRWFANSVYCKGFLGSSYTSLDYNYLRLIWPFFLCSVPIIIRKQPLAGFFWLPSIVYLGLLFGADPIVAFDNRLFLPAFALLLPLALYGMRYYLVHDSVIWFASLILILLIPKMSLADYRHFSENPVRGEQLRGQVIEWILNHTEQKDSIMIGDCGIIPYRVDRRIIDSYCLNNLSMTKMHRKHMYKTLCFNIELLHPDVVILTSLMTQQKIMYAPTDACLAANRFFYQTYKHRMTYETSGVQARYRYEIFVRKRV